MFSDEGQEELTHAFPNELRIKFPHHATSAFHGSISHQFIRPLAAKWAFEFSFFFFFIPTTMVLSKRKAAAGWARR